MFAAPVRLYRRAAYCFGKESIYPGFTDRVKGVLLRLAAEPRRGKLLKGSGKTYSVRGDIEESKPLGLATFQTTGAFKDIRLKKLP